MARKIGTTKSGKTGTVTSTGDTQIDTAPATVNPIDDIKTEFENQKTGIEEQRTKRKYTKRQPKDAEPDADAAEKVQAFSDMGKVLLRMGCARLPNPLPPSEEEEKMFSDSLGKVIVKYLPAAGEYSAEVTLAIACAGILIPRVIKERGESIPETTGTA
ncbi:MAG: hypothetical protein WC716_16845 [Chitinophagaceae bacterium]|jgi:hypothetical protein